MKNHLKGTLLVSAKRKAMPITAFAFFLGLTNISNAQLNISDGTVYGNLNGTTIITLQSGTNNLDILNPITTGLQLNEAVAGYISISNGFSGFLLQADTAGSLTSSNTAALSVFNGSNLTITNGTYTGGSVLSDATEWNGVGGILSNVQTANISSVSFTGGDLANSITGTNGPIIETPERGADAFVLLNSSNIIFRGDSTFTGGSGTQDNSSTGPVDSSGGQGLKLLSSDAEVNGGTFTGGSGGSAVAGNGFSSTAGGGHGIYASNSIVRINAGTFNGGTAGTENGATALGGSGLYAFDGSTVVVSNGIFRGASGAAAATIRNSKFTAHGGTFTTGGLLSTTTGSATNTIELMGGTFSSISFRNASSNGYQMVTTGTNLLVAGEVVQNGGIVELDNDTSSIGLQQIRIQNGKMIFNKDYTLAAGGSFTLSSQNSQATFDQLLDVSGTLDIGLGHVAANTLNLKSTGVLNFLVSSTNGSITTTGNTDFDPGATINIDASTASFSTGMTSVLILDAGSISDFTTNVMANVITTTDTNVMGRTTSGGIQQNGSKLQVIFNTATLSNYWNATGDLAVLADELDSINDPNMNILINNMGASASKAAVEETYFTKLNTMQTSLQGLNAALGLSLSRGTEFRETLNLPAGANGPDDEENDWRFWAKYYGQFYTHKKNDLAVAYDAKLHGGAIGMDKSYGPLLIGLSGGMGNYTIDSDNDSSEDINAAHGTIYATLGWGHSFLDLSAAYGFNNVESKSGGPFELEGEYDTQLISGYIGGGIGFELESIGTVLTPEVSAQFTSYTQDAYTEKSAVAVPRSFDEFDSDSLRTSLGLNAAMLGKKLTKTFNYKIEGRFHWLREMNPEPGDLNFQLVGGANDYLIAYPSLDEDIYRAGIGFTFFNTDRKGPENILLRLDFDELFGEDFNSHNLSAKVVYAF